jgi:hypothetical protein
MALWKLVGTAMKARRTIKRIPPERRREIAQTAADQVRTHGPTVAKAVGNRFSLLGKALAEAAKNARDEARKPPGSA